MPQTQRRGRAAGGVEAKVGGGFRQCGRLQEGMGEGGGRGVWQRLGLARARGRQTQGRQNSQRRYTDGVWYEAAADDRRLGARVLPRLSEQARRSCECLDRQIDELGIRGAKLGAVL